MAGQALAAAELPNAGSQIQQIPAPPPRAAPDPELLLPPPAPPTAVAPTFAEQRLTVTGLRLTGASAIREDELLTASGFIAGEQVALSGLRVYAERIANHYRARGYFLAQAHVPAQTVTDGVVTLVVSEGRYGQVAIRNSSSLSTPVAENVLRGLDPGDAVTLAPLESRLLQLADLPGVIVRSTLAPGATLGTSDLLVDIATGDRFDGSIDADNAGSRYTGRNRAGATLRFNEPFGLGDVATLRAFTSGDGLLYGRGAWQRQLGKADAGVAVTALRYELGAEFAPLDASGSAQVASLYVRYPLLRSRVANLHVLLGFDARRFRDRIDAATPSVVIDKRAAVGQLSLVGDIRDATWGGAITRGTLTLASGSLSADAGTPGSGHYDKLNLSLTRLQQVTRTISLQAALQGQLASSTLDVSEKLGLGGAAGVRAYPEGEAYVNEGYIANLEARVLVPGFSAHLPGSLQTFAFVDTGAGRVSGSTRTLSATGLGLTWFDGRTVVRAVYAHKLGAAAATSAPDSDGRVWVNLLRNF